MSAEEKTLAEVSREAIKALAPAAKAWKASGESKRYEQEWADEIARRRRTLLAEHPEWRLLLGMSTDWDEAFVIACRAKVTPRAAGARLAALERRGFVERGTDNRNPVYVWRLTARGDREKAMLPVSPLDRGAVA